MKSKRGFLAFTRKVKGRPSVKKTAKLVYLAHVALKAELDQHYHDLRSEFKRSPEVLSNLESAHQQMADHLKWLQPRLDHIHRKHTTWEVYDGVLGETIHQLADSFYTMIDELTDACGTYHDHYKVRRGRTDFNNLVKHAHEYLLEYADSAVYEW